MKSGDQFDVKILKLVPKGKGLARLEDKVVFIPYVLPQEEVKIEIKEVKKDYLLAEKISLLSSSPIRTVPPCPLFEKCGGCQWQMIDYPHQLQIKTELLVESLRRIGKLEVPVLPPIPASNPFFYRQRVKFQSSFSNEKNLIGFYHLESKEIVPVDRCHIISPLLNSLLGELTHLIITHPDPCRSIREIRISQSSPKEELLIELEGKLSPGDETTLQKLFDLPFKIKGVILSDKDQKAKILGKGHLINEIPDPLFPKSTVKIRSSAGGFSQINWEMNLKLIETVIAWANLTGKENLLELYSGGGNFTLVLAKRVANITAVEESPSAVDDLRYNIQANQVLNCSVRKGSVRAVLSRWDRKTHPVDLLVLDPPREGVDSISLQSILKIRPIRILYISCDPATLARDLKLLSPLYLIQRMLPFDMFPQTSHIETLTELILNN
ncbi:MAG: 23S rRNA (uracil(1939)-C(5))-methyltransferase RlmD [Nitrospirae bacterium]|nr:23S rRNA (uracil(1939)-C(5))-methyltransferase RlmD [Nitrospirota bacterium]